MIIKFNDFINEELVKNPLLLRSYLLPMVKKIQELGKVSIKYDKGRSVYYKLILSEIDTKYSKLINKIIKSTKDKLAQNDMILSYKEYQRQYLDLSADLDMIPTGRYYLEYVIYLKNLHTKRIKPDRYVYHYSSPHNRESILKNGLTTKSHADSKRWGIETELEYPNAIFAVGNDDKWIDGDKWQIDTQGLPNKWWEDLNFVNRKELIMTFEPIPKDHIKLV